MTGRFAAKEVSIVVGAVAAATVSACCPLLVYGSTLALLGVPHALVELRWVTQRYGVWRTAAARCTVVLSVIVWGRAAGLAFGAAPATLATIELALGMLLVACVLQPAGANGARAGGLRCGAAIAVLVLLGFGVARAPVDTMLVLAIVHNLTPAGFVADRLRDADVPAVARRRFAAIGFVVFIALPSWIVSGGAASLLGLAAADSTPGDLAAARHLGLELCDGLGAFTPSFVPPARALDLLRVAAFLQLVHYFAVLRVLPRLGPRPADERGAPRPPRWLFPALVLVLGLAFAAAFVVAFRDARAGYGVLAALHVWIEFPALLLALTPRTSTPVAA